MSNEEQRLRVQLAACYRIFDYLGWSELIYNHITAKLPCQQLYGCGRYSARQGAPRE